MFISIVTFVLVLSTLIVIHEYGHFIVARKLGIRVEKFSIGFGPVLFRRMLGDLEFLICVVPLGGYVKLAGENAQECKGSTGEFFHQPVGKRFQVIAAGPFFNYILAWLLFIAVFFVGFPVPTAKVKDVLDEYPAKAAGILPGDIITAVDGRAISNWEEMTKIIHTFPGDNLEIKVSRQGQEKVFNLIPKKVSMKTITGKTASIVLVGVTPSEETVTVRFGIGKSIVMAAQRVVDLTWLTLQALFFIMTGVLSFRESVSGPLGIFVITAQAAQIGLLAVIHLTAVLSLSLAVFNFLPLPILDGGHLFFLVLEKIRKKALSLRTEEIVNRVGIALLSILIIFTFYADIRKFGPKFFRQKEKQNTEIKADSPVEQ